MNKKNFLFPMLFVFVSSSIFAQGLPPPWVPPTDDPDMVPINNWIPVAILLAVLFAFKWFQKQLTKNGIDL